jgi:hypothetical protein
VSSATPQDTLTRKQINRAKKSYLLPGRYFSVEIPLWLPGFAGTFSYGNVNLEGEDGQDPGDPGQPPPPGGGIGGGIGGIFNRLFTKEWNLRFFYIGKLSFEKNRVLTELDAFGGEVGASLNFRYNNNEIVQANFRTINTRLILGFRALAVSSKEDHFRYWLFPYIGVRAHFNWLTSDLNNVINRLDINPIFFVPVVGIQNQFIWKRWRILLQGDVGGISFPDNYTIHISNFYYYRSGRFISLKFGWNHIFMNHNGTFRNEEYKIRVTLSGPAFGLAFHI